eukprot:CAMPEP_0173169110 /NCGR_PEP_ID=MMETSP1141-20130122/522_1 /TAXON_ID=483371 /ORGANISM="non described non described, Strain CCMP2298" /LENGTH=1289 /DNA_ID=CAMNT_0014090901 /DNA_START=267 /DNA_END=4138 /DNA_ORIENTATION=+
MADQGTDPQSTEQGSETAIGRAVGMAGGRPSTLNFKAAVTQQAKNDEEEFARKEAIEKYSQAQLQFALEAVGTTFQVFLKNLAFQASKEEILLSLAQFGRVLSFTELGKRRDNNANSGQANATFATREGMERCVSSLGGRLLRRRPYEAKLDPPKRSRAFQKDAGAELFSAQLVSLGSLSDAGYSELYRSRIQSVAVEVFPVKRCISVTFGAYQEVGDSLAEIIRAMNRPEAHKIEVKLNSLHRVHFSEGGLLTFRMNRPPYVFKGSVEEKKSFERTRTVFCSLLHRTNALQLQFASTDRGELDKLLRLLAHLRLRPGGPEAVKASPLLQIDPTVYHAPTWPEQLVLRFSTRYMFEQIGAVFGYVRDPAAGLVQAAMQFVSQGQEGQEGAGWDPSAPSEGDPDGMSARTDIVDRVLGQLLPSLLVTVRNRSRREYSARRANATTGDGGLTAEFAARLIAELAWEEGREDTALMPPEVPEAPMYVHVRRVLITPTRQICLPPEREVSNRAFRIMQERTGLAVTDDAEGHFLRVSFVDENLSAMFYMGGPRQPEELYTHIQEVLQGGIWVAGRQFSFLAWSSGMLKEHACWFSATPDVPGPSLTAVLLRSLLGDFTSINVVARCAARISQCFSSAVPTATLPRSSITPIPDLKTPCGKYTFSDGVGTVSPLLAEDLMGIYMSKVSPKLGQKLERFMPSARDGGVPAAFQIRLGGMKGVVSVDCRLTGRQLNYRPSMLKFPSSASVVEICAVTRLLPAYLNRQVITLLTGNGVPEAVFEDMQSAAPALASLHDAAQARALLLGGDGGFISTAGLRELLRGVDPLGDPFMRGMLKAALRSRLHDLRTRARIFVKQGVHVMGIMDEMGLLRYGEVYLHCSGGLCSEGDEITLPWAGDPDPLLAFDSAFDSASAAERPPKGADLLVTRCPCLHPGDVRVLRAVPLEELVRRARGGESTAHAYFSALPNVLVFPQQGSRPHPSECSGGDLDGDLYLALWDERLLPPLDRRNSLAMDYSAPPPQISPVPVSESQITDFFVHFIQNDQMGRIANAHLAHSDTEVGGVHSQICLELAQLHSTAVDFQKTGIPAVFDGDYKVHSYPDFMENEVHTTHASQRVLGRFYRAVGDSMREAAQSDVPVRLNPALVFPGCEYFYHDAWRQREAWEHDLLALMSKYGVYSEAELLSGHVQRYHTRAYERKKKYDVQLMLRREVQALVQEHRREFSCTAEKACAARLTTDHSDQDALTRVVCELASAWYVVSYDPAFQQKGRMLTYSFAWVVPEVQGFILKNSRTYK